MEFKIEKNIPIPEKKLGTGLTATFRQMEVGDSIVIPADRLPKHLHNTGQSLRRTIPSFSISVRKQQDGSYRVWRVA